MLLEMRYLVWEGEGVWSQLEVVNWEMSWEDLSHQGWRRGDEKDLGREHRRVI